MTLKELRKSKELTQLEASLICDIPLRSYKRLENDNKYQSSYKYQHAYSLLEKYACDNKDNKLSNKVISVVGMGYVGLSNAVILAQHNNVYAIDIDTKRLDSIANKKSPFVDKEIDEYLKIKKLNLETTTDTKKAYLESEIVIIATPTNYDSETNKFDTRSVESVIEDVISINPKAWIIIKSTVGVGFTKNIVEKYNYSRILFSPEFLREGKALYDNLYPSRIVVGIPYKKEPYLSKGKEFANLLKQGAIKENIETRIIGVTEAEAVKLFANTFLALRVAYFNELDTFALTKDLDALDIIKGVCADPRIGDFYNNPSFGYGGYCLPKDTKELKANFIDIPENLISASITSNETRKDFITNQIIKRLENSSQIVGIYRLTMKSGSDNFRQSSVQGVMERLLENNIEVVIYEPTLSKDTYLGCKVIKDLDTFKKVSKVIIANRYESVLDDVKNKVYTRDLLYRD